MNRRASCGIKIVGLAPNQDEYFLRNLLRIIGVSDDSECDGIQNPCDPIGSFDHGLLILLRNASEQFCAERIRIFGRSLKSVKPIRDARRLHFGSKGSAPNPGDEPALKLSASQSALFSMRSVRTSGCMFNSFGSK